MIIYSIQLILLVITIVLAIYWYSTRNHNYWKHRNVPFKKPSALFGSSLEIAFGKESSTDYFERLYNETDGPYYGFFSMNSPFLIVKDPNIIKRILIKDFKYFANRIIYNNEHIDPISSNFLLGAKSSTWKALRVKMSPVFTTGKIKYMTPLMNECAKNMVQYLSLKTGECIDTKLLAAKYTIDVIGSCVFGISVNSFANENNSFIDASRKLLSGTIRRTIQPLAYVFAHAIVWLLKLHFFDKDATTFLGNVFTQTITHRETTKIKRNDFVDILIKIKTSETEQDEYSFYDNTRLVAQAILFFAAGYETSSTTIAITLYELARNQEIQNRLRDEIKNTVRLHGEPTYRVVQSMEYLHMVVSETLRKYPAVAFLQRQCVEDYTVPETGLLIERGTGILISPQGLHRDPKYFPEPERYDPERFSKINKSKIQNYVYLPFGCGPRNCIGGRFALPSVKLGIFNIIKNFIVVPNSATRSSLVFTKSLLLHPRGGIPLTFQKIEDRD